MDQNPKAFLSLSKTFDGCMELVGYFNTGYPGLYFEPDIVAGLAKYSLSVDFDFYFYYLDSDDNEDA